MSLHCLHESAKDAQSKQAAWISNNGEKLRQRLEWAIYGHWLMTALEPIKPYIDAALCSYRYVGNGLFAVSQRCTFVSRVWGANRRSRTVGSCKASAPRRRLKHSADHAYIQIHMLIRLTLRHFLR